MLLSQGVPPAGSACRASTAARCETDGRKIWRRFAEHWHLFRGTPVAAVAGADLARGLRHRHAGSARRPPTRSTTRSPRGWPNRSSGRGRCSSGSTSRCSPRPSRRSTTSPTTPTSPPTAGAAGRPGHHHVPARTTSSTWSRPGLGGQRRPARRDHRRGHRRPTTAIWRRCGTRREHFIARRGDRHRPRPSDRADGAALRPPRPRRCYERGLRGTADAGGRRGVPRPHARRVRPDVHRGRPGDAAPPGRVPQPQPPAVRRHGRDVGGDIPRAPSTCGRWRRCSTGSATTRACGSCCTPSTRRRSPGSWRRSPAATRPLYLGAPWWFLDAPEALRRFREAVTETAGLLQHRRLRRRHAGVLLDPGAPRGGPPGRRGVPRPPRRRGTAAAGRGGRDHRRPRLPPAEAGVQAGHGGAVTPEKAIHESPLSAPRLGLAELPRLPEAARPLIRPGDVAPGSSISE